MLRWITPCCLFCVAGLTASVAAAQPVAAPAEADSAPAEVPHRVWREVNHGLRHGPSLELIEVGGGDGRLILLGDDHGYIYRSPDGGRTWGESRLSPDEDLLFPIPLPRLDEVVLPNVDLFDGIPDVRAPGVPRPSPRPGEGGDGGEDGGVGGAGGAPGGALQPRDRSEDPGDLLAAFARSDPAPWINWITTCETDDFRAYAATDEGLYRSDDAGFTWYRVFVGANDYENRVLTVLCDDADADRVHIGTYVGFFSSPDGGVSWQRPRSFTGAYATCYMESDAARPGRIIIGTYAGAYATSNLEDFETVFYPDVGAVGARYICSIVSTEQHLYLGSGDGGVVSHDGGETFERMAPGLLDRIPIGMMQADPRDDAHLYILTDDVFWESRDAGRTVVPLLARGATEPLKTFALDLNDPDRVLLLSGKQLLVLEPERPPRPARAADPVARAARQALRTSPPAGALVDGVLERMRLDNATVVGLRDAARRRNYFPQVSLVAGVASALGARTVTGPGTTWLVDDVYDPATCRLPVRPGRCWFDEPLRNLAVSDRAEPFVWGVGVLLRWNLSLAFFDRAETNSIWADVTAMRQRVMHTVADYWFERERALAELAGADHGADEQRQLTLRVAEMTAALDAMSGGMMTRRREGGEP